MRNREITADTNRSRVRSGIAVAAGMTAALALTVSCRAEEGQQVQEGAAQAQEGWEQVQGSVEQGGSYTAVAASAIDEIWVFGEEDADPGGPWAHLWNGQEWAKHELPPGLTSIPNVADTADGQVWTAGSSFEEEVSAARYDGESWTATEVEMDLGMETTAVAAVGTDSAWLLAESLYMDTDAAYFDGQEWTDRPAPTVAQGMDAVGTGEVFAVGGGGDGPIVERWDGSAWVPEELPEVDMPGNEPGASFNDVLARSVDDVWAVGAITWKDDDEHNRQRPLTAYYDGTEWTVEVGEDDGRYESVADDGDGGLYLVDGHWNSVLEHRTADGQVTRQQLTDDDHDINVDTVAGVPGSTGAVAVGSAFDKADPDEPTSHARVYGIGDWYD